MSSNPIPVYSAGTLESEVSRLVSLGKQAATIIKRVKEFPQFKRLRFATIEAEIAYQRSIRSSARRVERLADNAIITSQQFSSRKRRTSGIRINVVADVGNLKESGIKIFSAIFDCDSGLTKAQLKKCVKDQIIDYLFPYYQNRIGTRTDLARRVRNLRFTTIEGV